jgi:CDP-L-myo-inositol myo-inositolphosphotransferase
VPTIVLHFSHEATANFLVAGIPAAARAAHQVELATRETGGVQRCLIAVPGGWLPSRWCEAELARLAPDLEIGLADADDLDDEWDLLHLRGSRLLAAPAIVDLLRQASRLRVHTMSATPARGALVEAELAVLKQHGTAILAATGKAGDGIVSRTFNRPISRTISTALLQVPGLKPIHGTVAAAIVGVAMAVCLFSGEPSGLVLGALLFQLASIIDGVDGEIARATFRTSRSGSMLDSLTDAATNLAFFAGVAGNLWLSGQYWPAAAGAAGLVLLFFGLLMIGAHAVASNRPFSFDAVKEHFGVRTSTVRQWLTWLTMRDFYAAAAAMLVILGLAAQMLVMFAIIAAGWLAISLVVLSRAGAHPAYQALHTADEPLRPIAGSLREETKLA